MKTSKRKRSAKARPAARPVVEPVAELSEAAVAALAAEPALETVSETVAEIVSESVSEVVSESVEAVAEVVAEAIAESSPDSLIDPTAETVVADTTELAPAEPVPAGEPVVVLAANCSVKDAAALKTSLCAFANESTDVTLDVSAVERVDTATMQLLCAFVRDRSGRQQNVAWRGESQALQDAVRLLGVGELLGLEAKGVAA